MDSPAQLDSHKKLGFSFSSQIHKTRRTTTTDIQTTSPQVAHHPFLSLFLHNAIRMVPLELSQHLELYSKDQASCKYDPAPHSNGACLQKVATRRCRAMALNHIEANRGSGDEVVAYLSFGRASSLVIVVFFLSSCVDFSYLCIMMGAVASTISAANELRHETLMIQTEQEILRQSMQETSNTLMHAIHELRQVENQLMRPLPRPTSPSKHQEKLDLGHSASVMLESE